MGIFSKPKAPALPEVPAEPTNAEIAASAEEDKQGRRLQKGRASTMLGGDDVSKVGGTLGDDTTGLATKTLLGG